jgi:hypothetical protein
MSNEAALGLARVLMFLRWRINKAILMVVGEIHLWRVREPYDMCGACARRDKTAGWGPFRRRQDELGRA